MRLFLAVTPEPHALDQVASVVARLRRALDADAVLRWVDVAQQHLTLHFLGEIEPVQADRLLARLATPLAEAPFDMELGGLGIFPPAGVPRVVWMGVHQGGAALTRIHDELSSSLRDADLPIEARAFTPHLTLARVRGDRRDTRRLRERLVAMPATAGIGSRVDRVTLFESDLSGPRPRYRALVEPRLSGGQIVN